jgi:hypothetical protein
MKTKGQFSAAGSEAGILLITKEIRSQSGNFFEKKGVRRRNAKL